MDSSFGWYGGFETPGLFRAVARFPEVKRDLALAVEPALFLDIEGSTDSEMFFFLALSSGPPWARD